MASSKKILKENDIVYKYIGTIPSVKSGQITLREYCTLQKEQFVNDSIVEFCVDNLFKRLCDKERNLIHIFSHRFWQKITQWKIADGCSKEKYRHNLVANWTKSVDIFQKDLLLFYICNNEHWYFVIVQKPGLIDCTDHGAQKDKPQMLVFDSYSDLGRNHSSELKVIRDYLKCEWAVKKKLRPLYEFSLKEVKLIQPKIPQQPNGFDCALYMLHNLELMFQM